MLSPHWSFSLTCPWWSAHHHFMSTCLLTPIPMDDSSQCDIFAVVWHYLRQALCHHFTWSTPPTLYHNLASLSVFFLYTQPSHPFFLAAVHIYDAFFFLMPISAQYFLYTWSITAHTAAISVSNLPLNGMGASSGRKSTPRRHWEVCFKNARPKSLYMCRCEIVQVEKQG